MYFAIILLLCVIYELHIYLYISANLEITAVSILGILYFGQLFGILQI